MQNDPNVLLFVLTVEFHPEIMLLQVGTKQSIQIYLFIYLFTQLGGRNPRKSFPTFEDY